MKMSVKCTLLFTYLIISITNISPVNSWVDSLLDPDHYAYSNEVGTMIIICDAHKGNQYMDSVKKGFRDKHTILYRLFWKNPLAFWRWRDYISRNEKYSHPYKSWSTIVENRKIMLKRIDAKLNKLARRFGTHVEESVGGYNINRIEVPKDKLEIRKILWTEGEIGKGIILHQNFENKTFDTPDWDLTILAWFQGKWTINKGRPIWVKQINRFSDLRELEANIDEILKQSVAELSLVKLKGRGNNIKIRSSA